MNRYHFKEIPKFIGTENVKYIEFHLGTTRRMIHSNSTTTDSLMPYPIADITEMPLKKAEALPKHSHKRPYIFHK